MYGGKRFLGVIIARGGSKGLPRKNLLPVAGRPMLAWTVRAGLESTLLDRLVISTEDTEIMEAARQCGCEVPFRRPLELSQDHVSGVEPVLHAIDQLPGYDYVVLLQATSPLRTGPDIDGAIRTCLDHHAECCTTVSEAPKNPAWMFTLSPGDRLAPVLAQEDVARCRQQLNVVYALNGAVYVCSCEFLRRERRFLTDRTVGHVMPRERAIDVDHHLDLLTADALLRHRSAAERQAA